MNSSIPLDQCERMGRETGRETEMEREGKGEQTENRWRKNTAEIVHKNKETPASRWRRELRSPRRDRGKG